MARMRLPVVPQNLGAAGTVRLEGMKEYARRLQELGDGMVTRGCVVALAPGANILREAARARAPVLKTPDPRRRPLTLKNAVQALRVKTTRFAATFVVGIRLLKGSQVAAFKKRTGKAGNENPDDPFYGTILEYGKTPRTRRPFLKPAFDAAAKPAVQTSFEHLKRFTEREIRRIGGTGR